MRRIGRLHVLTDIALQERFSHLELARLAVQGGADVIQFRQKTGSTRSLIETAREMKAVCAAAGAVFIVNDRIDVAMASGADGVHLGQEDFPIGPARELLGAERIIGGSASNLEEAAACVRDGADYVGFGPVFPTTSKADAGPAGGLEALRSVSDSIDAPVIAIGGINEENAAQVMDSGAYGIAVISSVCCRPDPDEAAFRLCRLIRKA
ncbi:MAG: thiamine phosphate synthase [Deltaproteobacteria bacterium]|nr:thiamine phosphate synthase [Deltaproteobacteria bacterium]